ncbi:hypothetical protein [Marinococcus halophilus]|uniref:hypothetical protein n=1 Tax=Marinococcus halophilus TaxID=1371 RepID=UPI0009A8DF41|nr:hypothetical protein [Marinococcus halophilus]
MKRRIRLTALYGSTFLVISIIVGYIFDGEFDETFVAGHTIGGIIIGLFIAPHYQENSEEETPRLVRINRIITNTVYIFLILFFIMFSLNFIFDSTNWKATSFSAIPLIIALIIKLVYQWRVKKFKG